MALKWLEPYAGKLASTVLRGRSYGNITPLPDRTRFSQRKTILIESLQSGIAMAQKIIKKRKARGYQTTYNIAL